MLYPGKSLHGFAVSFLKVVFFAVLAGMMFASCVTDAMRVSISGTWQFEGLEGITVYELRKHNGHLYVGTERGFYRSPISNISWQSMGVDEASVRTFAVFSDQELLAQVHFSGADSSTIAKTTDGGQNWVLPYRNGFGGGSRVTPRALEVHPHDKNILFARGLANVAKSEDRGNSWESIHLTWEHFISNASLLKIDSGNPDIIWAGGSTAIFSPNLAKSVDGGETWKRLNEELQIFEDIDFESTAYSIAIHPGRSFRVLLGLGVGIFRSDDFGESWESVFSEASARTLVNGTHSVDTVYASGGNLNRTLFVLVSFDFGNSWQTLEMEDSPKDIWVNDMAVVEQNGQEVLYLGTNQGMYSYTFTD